MKAEKSDRIRVLGVAPSLGGGGAEMSLLRLVNHLDRGRFRPGVAVARSGGAYEADLAEDVDLNVLCEGPLRSSRGRVLRAALPLRRLVQRTRPDVVVSVLSHVNLAVLLSTWRLDPCPQVVLSVQNNPRARHEKAGLDPTERAVLFLVKRFYRRADQIVAISKGVETEVAALIPGVQRRTTVIHNAGVDETVRRKAQQPVEGKEWKTSGEKLVVACGRLTEQKGFPFLLRAFARLREAVPARLRILGEGAEREHLERLACRLGVATHVQMPGFVDNPYRHMAAADVFALSSLWEGFGNVVVEAMACGTPVVVTDCPHGPGEIVEGGESGLLVPPADAGALADALTRVLTNAGLRVRLAEAAKRRARDFTAVRVAEQYERLFERLAPSRVKPSGAVQPVAL